jgi:hypothetical protein
MSTLPRTRRHGRTHIARCDEHAFRILFRAALEPVEPSPRCEAEEDRAKAQDPDAPADEAAARSQCQAVG